MDTDTVNNLVKNFITTSTSDTDLLDKWLSDDNQTLVFGKMKKTGKLKKLRKSAYLFFCDAERERLRGLDIPIVKRTEVHLIMSANWNKLKESRSDEYYKYVNMSTNYITVGSDIETVQYEVTKPFHKFSLVNRKNTEDEFMDDTANDITQKLVSKWDKLSMSEKKGWSI